MMVSVVVVTHNSLAFISRCLTHLRNQSRRVDEVIVVDNKSDDTQALRRALESSGVQAKLIELNYNVGYAGGCNVATEHLSSTTDYVLYLGPDTYLTEKYVASAAAFMEEPRNSRVAAVSGKLLGFDNDANRPTGLIDSTGIEQTWYGRWYDRGQGRPDTPHADKAAPTVPALCGTALFCRRSALARLEMEEPFTIYDGSLFMYKEDIDLSRRLRRLGCRLMYHSGMIAFHCRGWQRKAMSRRAKVLSARNEAVINSEVGLVKYLFSCLKLFAVSRGLL